MAKRINVKGKIRTLKFLIKKKRYKYKEENKKSNVLPVTHITYYACRNAGDTILSKCVRQTFKVLARWEKWTLKEVTESVTNESVQKMNEGAAVVCGGGGLFLPDTNKNDISGWQWAISKEQLEHIEVPLIVYSVGYNYFRGQKPTELFIDNLKCLVKKASFVGLRNRGSVQAVQQLVGEELAAKVVYQPCTTTCIRKIFELPEKQSSNRIAVNMAFDREDMRYGQNKDIILKQVALAIKEIQQKGYDIVYVAHCYHDRKFLKYLEECSVVFSVFDMSDKFPQECFEFYNSIDLVMGMRGHAQMIPFGLNCEIITLGTHDKMKWFLEDIDCVDWYEEITVDVDALSKRLVDKFVKIHEVESKNTKDRLIEKQNYLWDITRKNWEEISKNQ